VVAVPASIDVKPGILGSKLLSLSSGAASAVCSIASETTRCCLAVMPSLMTPAKPCTVSFPPACNGGRVHARRPGSGQRARPALSPVDGHSRRLSSLVCTSCRQSTVCQNWHVMHRRHPLVETQRTFLHLTACSAAAVDRANTGKRLRRRTSLEHIAESLGTGVLLSQ